MTQLKLASKPPIYQGHPIPLKQLSSDSFEDFTYQCLSLLGPKKGFEMQSGPQPSGDQGFDCTAKTTDIGGVVCIQCKRYTTTTLSINTVAEELIKVGLDGKINKSTINQHYIITSGTVAGNLRQALRQDNYLELKKECEKLIKKRDCHKKLLETAEDSGIKPIDTVLKYIDSLDNLVIWSGLDFTNELLIIWTDLDNILEKHFSLEKVLKDTPTPNFDIKEYLSKFSKETSKLTTLHYSQSKLPNNLKSNKDLDNYKKSLFSIEDLGLLLKSGKNIILSSPGGSGKSSTLSLLHYTLVGNKSDIEFLPVKIRIRSYSRNNLNEMINHELGITYGSWKSLPFKMIFLFDGLDEMLQHDTQAFYDDLSSIIGNNSYILTTRNTGLTVRTTSALIDTCFSIQPLSYRSVLNVSAKVFTQEKQLSFCNEYRKKVGKLGHNYLSSPFALSLSTSYYEKHGTLPNGLNDVLENWISNKIEEDKNRIKSTSLKLNGLSTSKIKDVFSLITYKAKFEKKLISIPEEQFLELLVETYNELEGQRSYISMLLDLYEFIEMIKQYEIYFKGEDGHFSTPHAIISDYLASKVLSKTWTSYKEAEFDSSQYDTWLHSSDYICDDDKEDYLETVFSFDISLGARVAKKFQGKYIKSIQDRILELEKSTKVLTRSDAIHALGILGTEDCYNRLRSKDGCLDHHHQSQRRRALAVNGDRDTLVDILVKNEQQAQFPMKISGGEYGIWFSSLPTSITDIARERLEQWLNNEKVPLCMSLRTLALFGDDYDVKSITSVLEATSHEQEFYDASKALFSINKDMLVKVLKKIIDDQKGSSYWAKQVLVSMGLDCNIDDEFNYFIEQSKNPEIEMAENSELMYVLMDLVEFMNKNSIDDDKISILIETYNNLNFSSDFYYTRLIWNLAQSGKPGCFLPIVKQAYLRGIQSEIHLAIHYLSSLENLELDEELSTMIDEHFESLTEESIGTFYYYIDFYYNHKSKEIAMSYFNELLKKELSNLSPTTISREDHITLTLKYNLVFHFLHKHIEDNIKIDDEYALKFLLIDTSCSSDMERNVKLKILNSINKKKIDNFYNDIESSDVKLNVASYLLYNDLSSEPESLIEEYILFFLSNHIFHPTLESICKRYWNDNLARLFLTSFVELNWNDVNAQMFEKYTNFFLNLITKEQLETFEQEREKKVSYLVKRIYHIWLENHNIS
ncbi:TPA: restriction endonuclease [Vibrio parahaemolyticus]|nr:restriction endonuclease [Vibrio parahaemolyticus]